MRRRDFLAGCAAALASCALPPKARAQHRRAPNIILILSDDQGSVDLNCYGATDLHTPHLDELATRGVRFSQFYVGSPICSASRAALLTGRYPQRAGLATNAGQGRGLPPEQVTLAELLQEAGYRTGLFGKWHLGEEPDMLPGAQGFEAFFGHKGGCIDNFSHFFYWSGPNRHDLWRDEAEVYEDGAYFPELLVREANRFMETHQEQPFFLYLPFNIPHYPMQPLLKWREHYAHLEEPRRRYAALVSTMDEKIGEIVGKVDALGLREDTLIVFLSDHGHSVEERTFFGGGSSGPYRGHKFTLWEGGIRVPAIISWPGRIPEGETRDQPCMSSDLFPTLAAYAGAAYTHDIDGRSLQGVLEHNAEAGHAEFHWQLRDHWAAREGDWKLIMNADQAENMRDDPPPDPVFLVNLREDPGERTNLAASHPEMVKRLTALHEAWAAP
jgi:arylsulfatase A